MDKEIFLSPEGYQKITEAIGGEDIDIRWCERPDAVTWAYADPDVPKLNGLQYHFTRADAEKRVSVLNEALVQAGIDTAAFEMHPVKYDHTEPFIAGVLEEINSRSIFTRAAVALGLKNPAEDDVFINLVRVNDNGGHPSVWHLG